MNRFEFLNKLEKGLAGLPEDITESTLEYYSEMIDDRIEAGESEEEAVKAMESIEEIVSRTVAEIPLPKLVREKVKQKKRISTLSLVLIIIGSPIWLSLGIAALSAIISVYAALWGTVVSLYACFASTAVMVPYSMLSAVLAFIRTGTAQGFVWIGTALFSAGLAILALIVSNLSAKAMLFSGKRVWLWIKSLFVRKGDA